MSKMIQIRNVSDETHRILKTRAAAAGMSLSDYIKRELDELASLSSWEELDERIQARGPSGLRTQDILDALREVRGE